MTPLFRMVAEWLMRHRTALPGWMNRAMESVARNPDGLIGRLAGRALRGSDVAPTSIPDTPVRLYIAPTNYSGQGYAWARAVERADESIGARNVAVRLPGDYGFPADVHVPIATVNSSSDWADAEWESARRFTHVLVEAERSLFGRRFGRDLQAEVEALGDDGISVAYLCHGTDIRDPDKHAKLTPWSPYPEDPRTDLLRTDAKANLALLARLRRPTFVSTPDLIIDAPWARWCPVVIDPARFATARTTPAATGEVLRVTHVPSAPLQKGSHLITPVMEALSSRRSDIAYLSLSSVPSAEMPNVFAETDVLLDQFRLGSYGVAACEAMSAGRIVIGHVLPFVRERVRSDFGIELPIVEATPDTLDDVLSELADDRDRARRIAALGPAFVETVHNGNASARVLIDDWIRN